MCIISVVDTKPNILNSQDIRLLTMTNSLLGNQDGFGYYLFSDTLVKTKEEAIIYWRDKYTEFSNKNDVNGIYHVRKASFNYNATNLSTDEKSHPFNYNDIIVAHNGFLTFRTTHINAHKFDKYLFGDLIDSQKFSIVLSTLCERGKVTIDNIKTALNMFSGAYCLAIKGKKDNNAWLIRGKDRILYNMSIKSGEEVVGTLINTSNFTQILLGEFLLDYGLTYKIEELKENTAYSYELGSYNLVEKETILQDSTFDAVKTPPVIYNNNYKGQYNCIDNVTKSLYEDILELMYSMNLLSSDLVILSEIIFNKPLFILNESDFQGLKVVLTKLKNEAHKGRIELWLDIQKEKIPPYYLYTKAGIQYPYLMNSKDELKQLLVNLKENRKEKSNELPAVQ